MATLNITPGTPKFEELQGFLKRRFTELEDLRKPLDLNIAEEIDLYNNVDKKIDAKESWEAKYRVPFIYTVVQTMIARMKQALFSKDNYIKFYPEDDRFYPLADEMEKWLQYQLDRIGFKKKARDFLESSLIQRTAWIQARPVKSDDKLDRVEFDILSWFDVWFDTKAKDVDETDFFVRKIKKMWQVRENAGTVYFADQIDKVKGSTPPDDIIKKQVYQSEHGTTYYDPQKNSSIDEVELLEYYGEYDVSEDPEKPDFRSLICTIANRTVLIRVQENGLFDKIRRKRLFFPLRPMRQTNSLIGKSVPQIARDQQYELNEVRSLRIQHLKLLVNLLFKYNKNGDIDFNELFAEGGNAIGFEGNPNDIDIFPIQSRLQELSFIGQEIAGEIQQVTGATDYTMGTSAGRGITETARGINTITEQSVFKLSMLADNIADDLLDFVTFILVLNAAYNKEGVIQWFATNATLAEDFFGQDLVDIETSRTFDLNISDLAERRDIERAQWVNAMNVIGPLVQQNGGDMTELLRQFLKKVGYEQSEKLVRPSQMVQQQLATVQQALSPEGQQIIQLFLQAQKAQEQKAELTQKVEGKMMGKEATAIADAALRRGETVPANMNGQAPGGPVAPQANAATPDEMSGQVNA